MVDSSPPPDKEPAPLRGGFLLTRTPKNRYNEAMEIIIDKIALWRPKINDAFTVRTSAIGTPYRDKNGARQIATKPIYRYAKTYTLKDGKEELKFSLFVRTLCTDSAAVQEALDAAAKKVTAKQVREAITNPVYSAFEYLNEYIGDK